jgi:hypothetical protein
MTKAPISDLSYMYIDVSYAYNKYKISDGIYDLEVFAIYIQESENVELKEKKGCV